MHARHCAMYIAHACAHMCMPAHACAHAFVNMRVRLSHARSCIHICTILVKIE